uniref:Uncharacterized protein n=1 Tax=Rhizophora mucronata TaxID=61149 RepID=A0A2P2LBF4_RHIMU
MGMGEPMLNLKAVLEAHQCLNKVLVQLFVGKYLVRAYHGK